MSGSVRPRAGYRARRGDRPGGGDLTVAPGVRIAVVGPNGVGKTAAALDSCEGTVLLVTHDHRLAAAVRLTRGLDVRTLGS